MTPETEEKRIQFQQYIEQVLAPETAVKAVIGIGSIATGHMTADSDIDAIIFFDPLDLYIAPAEAVWQPENDTYHSIFAEADGIQFDFLRLSWQTWADPEFEWPEGRKAELSAGWIAYDPDGAAAQLIAQRTAYDETARLNRLDNAIIWLDQHLHWKPEAAWEKLGPAIAHDRLEAAYHYLVDALFAYNRRWRVWRNREMQTLLTLPWLPDNFEERVLTAANAPSLDHEGYLARLGELRSLFNDLLRQLIDSGGYAPTPIDQAFMRQNEEPGRSWNMDEWQRFYQARKLSLSHQNGTNS
ncbi:MAG: hypothetical protein ACE5FD_17560 [Anaerolineae bacterium]